MKFSFILLLVLCHGICLAEDLPGNQKKAGKLTVQEAAELVEKANASDSGQYKLDLKWLTLIDRDVARELSHYKGKCVILDGLASINKDVAHGLAKFKGVLRLDGLTSIDKDVAQELGKSKAAHLGLVGLTSIDKDVAQDLAQFKGRGLTLGGLTSIDKDVAQELAEMKGGLSLYNLTSIDKDVLKILKAKPGIMLPLRQRDLKERQQINAIKSIRDIDFR